MNSKPFPWPLLAAFSIMLVLGIPGFLDRLLYEHHHVAYGRIVPWGIWVAAYMFFAGLSAGAFLVSTLATVFNVERCRPLVGLSLLTSMVALGTATFFVTADLGRPDRGYFILLHSNPASVMVWLGWLYSAFGLILVLKLALVLRPRWAERAAAGGGAIARFLAFGYRPTRAQDVFDRTAQRLLGAVGLIVALILPGCAGTLLAVVAGRPVWHSGLFPVTFVVAAIVSGASIVMVLGLLLTRGGRAHQGTLVSLSKIVGAFLAVEFAILISEVLIARRGEIPSHVAVIETMTNGPFSWVFWIVQIGLGTVLPIGLILMPRPEGQAPRVSVAAIACLLALCGAFAFRINLLIPQQTLPAINFITNAKAPFEADPVYVPNWVEWNFLMFGIGLAGVGFLAAYRLLPLARKDEPIVFELAMKREQAAHGYAVLQEVAP